MSAKRILISLPAGLLAALDRQAQTDFSSRSEMVRRALLEYLRPMKGRLDEDELFTDPEELRVLLQHRKLRASVQKMVKEMKRGRRPDNAYDSGSS
jgi:metal-responsive CopG/Arc/MetJ family transcriptional regulator